MMQGCIDFLLGDSKEAEYLRESCVFKIVPMVNPDGVIHGNYRCSLAGCDLNRRWKKPRKKLHPSVFHLKEMIKNFSKEREIKLVVDLHGHSRKMNTFFYGCSYKEDPVQARVFPYMMSKYTEDICFDECRFHVQKSKDKTARISLWKELRVNNVFTMEASFFGKQKGTIKSHYSIQNLFDIGKDLMITLNNYLLEEEEEKTTNKRQQLSMTRSIILKQIKENEAKGISNQSDSEGSDSDPSEDELPDDQMMKLLPKEMLTKRQKQNLLQQQEEENKLKEKKEKELKQKLLFKKQELLGNQSDNQADRKRFNASKLFIKRQVVVEKKVELKNDSKPEMIDVAVQTDASFIMEMKAYLLKRQSLQNGISSSGSGLSSLSRNGSYLQQPVNRINIKAQNNDLTSSSNHQQSSILNSQLSIQSTNNARKLQPPPSLNTSKQETMSIERIGGSSSMKNQGKTEPIRYLVPNFKGKPQELQSPKAEDSLLFRDKLFSNFRTPLNDDIPKKIVNSLIINNNNNTINNSIINNNNNNSILTSSNNTNLTGYIQGSYPRTPLNQNRQLSIENPANNMKNNKSKIQPQQTPTNMGSGGNLPALTLKTGNVGNNNGNLNSQVSPKIDANIFKKSKSQANTITRNGKAGTIPSVNPTEISSSCRNKVQLN